jgi:hypothetical protein
MATIAMVSIATVSIAMVSIAMVSIAMVTIAMVSIAMVSIAMGKYSHGKHSRSSSHRSSNMPQSSRQLLRLQQCSAMGRTVSCTATATSSSIVMRRKSGLDVCRALMSSPSTSFSSPLRRWPRYCSMKSCFMASVRGGICSVCFQPRRGSAAEDGVPAEVERMRLQLAGSVEGSHRSVAATGSESWSRPSMRMTTDCPKAHARSSQAGKSSTQPSGVVGTWGEGRGEGGGARGEHQLSKHRCPRVCPGVCAGMHAWVWCRRSRVRVRVRCGIGLGSGGAGAVEAHLAAELEGAL